MSTALKLSCDCRSQQFASGLTKNRAHVQCRQEDRATYGGVRIAVASDVPRGSDVQEQEADGGGHVADTRG